MTDQFGPPMEFDGRIFWYLEYFDPTDDRCCAWGCRRLIDEDDVPLILFNERPDGATWQTRLHVACAERLGFFRQIGNS